MQAGDRIIALVSGYPKAIRERRKLVVLQAVIDDSGKGGKPVFVLAGFVLSAYKWSVFADQWKAILDMPPAIEYFKMNEAWQCVGQFQRFSTKERDERLKSLVSLIVDHRPLAIREIIHHEHYERHFKGKIAKRMDYPYFLCVTNIIGTMIRYQLDHRWNVNNPVDFVFDQQGKESEVLQRVWQWKMENIPPPFKPLLGSRPIYRDEKNWLPLQAADLFAWQTRRFYAEKAAGKEYADPAWKELSKLECAEYEWPEKQVKWMIDGLRASGMIFEHDLKYSPKKLRKAYKRILEERFPDEGKDE